MLAGGLIQQFGKFHKVTAIMLGLVGAFLGGVIANVSQLDLGLGPVLVRYEDLIASLVGGVVIVLAAKWIASRQSKRAANK